MIIQRLTFDLGHTQRLADKDTGLKERKRRIKASPKIEKKNSHRDLGDAPVPGMINMIPVLERSL